MARIQAQTLQIDTLRGKLAGVKNKSADAAGNVAKVKANLDWQVASRSNIDARLASVQKRIQKQADMMNQYASFLNTVNGQFGAKDGELRNKAKGIIYQLGQVGAAMVAIAREKIRSSYQTDQKLMHTAAAGTLFGAKPINNILLEQVGSVFAKLKEYLKRKFTHENAIVTNAKEYGGKDAYQDMVNAQKARELTKELAKYMDKDFSKISYKELKALKKDLKKMEKEFADDPTTATKIVKRVDEIAKRIAGIENGTISTKIQLSDKEREIYNQNAYTTLPGMADSGCSVTAAAYAMTALGIHMAPDEVYGNNGSTYMVWDKAVNNKATKTDIVPYHYSNNISDQTVADAVIKANMDPNSSPVILHAVPKGGYSHYVVVESVVRDKSGNITGFEIHETSTGKRETIKLSDKYVQVDGLFTYMKK